MADDRGDLFLPHQTHRVTSRLGSEKPSRFRATSQERWMYETLQSLELADWQIWQLLKHGTLFDRFSSMQRARIGLLWVNRKVGPSPYHPVCSTGRTIINPASGVDTVIWGFKDLYRKMTYGDWVDRYKKLARESR